MIKPYEESSIIINGITINGLGNDQQGIATYIAYMDRIVEIRKAMKHHN